jgi:hypothetical protein
MDYFNRLILVIVPRLEPECERRYSIPRSLHESVRARVLEMGARSIDSDLMRPSLWAHLWYVPARLQLGLRA